METIQSTNTNRSTPWGHADYQYIIAHGVAWVNTPSHGGFAIGVDIAQTYLTQAARSRGTMMGSYLFYEEDCDATIVLYEHPELFALLNFTGEDTLLESLSYWNADYLLERGLKEYRRNGTGCDCGLCRDCIADVAIAKAKGEN